MIHSCLGLFYSEAEMGLLPLLNQDHGKIVPFAIVLILGVDFKAVMPGGLEHIDATGP
jgi:hypothetical protein